MFCEIIFPNFLSIFIGFHSKFYSNMINISGFKTPDPWATCFVRLAILHWIDVTLYIISTYCTTNLNSKFQFESTADL